MMRPAFVRVSLKLLQMQVASWHFDVYVIRAYAHMCACHDVCVCMCVYIYVYMYMCIFLHKGIYVCIHICILYCLCACVWFNPVIHKREYAWCKWHTSIYESIQHVQDTSKKRSINANNANNATHYVKLGKKRRESCKCNCSIMSPRVIIKAIIIIVLQASRRKWQWRVLREFKAFPLEKVSPNYQWHPCHAADGSDESVMGATLEHSSMDIKHVYIPGSMLKWLVLL